MRDILTCMQSTILYDSFSSIFNHLDAPEKQCIFLIDENVYNAHISLFKDYKAIVIPAGEQYKSLSFAETVIEQMIGYNIDKAGYLIGVGGGVVCDLTGFIASIYLRGITFALIPTSLLAMVDAAIGGKNAVNSPLGKNLIGLINQPVLILCDVDFLKSLPAEEVINGMAEIIKHACIASREYFEYIELNLESILNLEHPFIEQTILESAKIKAGIVSRDPLEKSERFTLNYGHTYGHAYEKALGISHGNAVSLGIVTINRYAVALGSMSATTADRIKKLLLRAGLRTETDADETNYLSQYLKVDKKRHNENIRLAIVPQIGQCEVVIQPLTTLI